LTFQLDTLYAPLTSKLFSGVDLTLDVDAVAAEQSGETGVPEQEKLSFRDLGLRDEILKALDEAGYETPTPIQAEAIPHALKGDNVVGLAQTGTGKTASFTLPMIHVLASGRARARMPRSLIISPTRELATQTAENFEKYGKHLKLSMALLIGGVAMGDQEKALEKGVDVLIATPGRLLDWFERGKLLLGGIECLVIDEADRMLDMGFMPDVERILSLIVKRKQTLLFSATMPPEVRRLADKFLKDPVEIKVAPPKRDKVLVTERLLLTSPRNKSRLIKRLLEEQSVSKAIIFCNRKKDISGLTRSLKRGGFNARDLHGDLDQSQRNATLEAFKADEFDYLVATDVAARGLDISDMPVVVNYDVPMNAEDYIHRIGRTGRAGKEGRAFTFGTDDDRKFLINIEKLRGAGIEELKLDPKEREAKQDDSNDEAEDGEVSRQPRRSNARSSNVRQASTAPRRARNTREERDSGGSVKGLGSHVPAFLLRPTPLSDQQKAG
jgi:superfamily II DNA/RNA helicase